MKLFFTTLCATVATTSVFSQSINDSITTLDLLYYQWSPGSNSVKQYKNKQVLVLDSTYFKAAAIEQVDQALRTVAGIDVRQRGASGVQVDVGIDGGTFDQTMVLVNGLKLTDPQTGHNLMMLPIEWSMIREMQVIKGAASSMYGVNALAGTINFITQTPNENYLQVRLNGGSSLEKNRTDDIYYNTGVHVQGGVKSGHFYHQLQGGWKGSNGYRHNTAYTSPNVWYQSEGTIGKHNIQLMAGYRYMDFGANGFYAAPGDSSSQEAVQNTVAGLKHVVPITKKLYWHNDLVYLYKTDDYKYIKDPVIGQNIHYQNIWNYTSSLRLPTRFGNFKAGVEWRSEDLNSTNLGRHSRTNIGGLINYDYLVGEKLSLEAGVYMNHNSDYGTQLYPNLGVGYYLSSNAKIIANIGTGQRLPTFTDLYYKQRGVIEGNASLKAEQAWNAELGYQFTGINSRLNVYAFYRSIDQFIDWTRASVSDVWRPNNYHQLNTLGLHASWNQQKTLNANWAVGYLLSYNFINPSLVLHKEAIISRYAISALRHHAVLGAYATLQQNWKFQLGAAFHERISYKQYTLWNASITYTKHRWNAGIQVQNIGNIEVKEAGANPLPGRWIQANLQYRIF